MKLKGSLTIENSNEEINGLVIKLPLTPRLKNFLEKKCQVHVKVDTTSHSITLFNGIFQAKKIASYNQLCEKLDKQSSLEKPYQLFQDNLFKLEEKINHFEEYGIGIDSHHDLKCFPGYGKTTIIRTIVEKLKKSIEDFETSIETNLNFKNKALFEPLAQDIDKIIKPYKAALEEHRHPSKVFIYNLLIAMSLIGIILIVGKLLYSKLITGRAEYFFSQTKSSQLVNEIQVLSQTIAM
jgi:hypothetical protein